MAALALASTMVSLLPRMKQEKHDEALIYGALSFTLTGFLFPWNFLIAVMVWIYFRYEATTNYNVEITRFDGWKLRLRAQ